MREIMVEGVMRLYLLSLVSLGVASSVVFAPGCSSSSSSPSDTTDASSSDSATQDAQVDASDGGVCSASQYAWATSGGGPGQNDDVNGVAVDKDGNTWVTGTFIGTTTWGTFTLTAVDTVHTSIFVAKLDPNGKVLFARTLEGDADGGTGGLTNIDNYGSRIRVDASGDAYVVGHYEKQLDVDDVHLVENNAGNGSVFLVKLDHATGHAIWGTGSHDSGDGESAYDLALDASGNVYVIGEYNGSIQFGSHTSSVGSSDKSVFVAKYSQTSSDWEWLDGWAGQVSGTNDGGVGYGVVATSDGNVYVTGTVSVSLLVGTTLLTNDKGSFFAKLGASDGSVAWVTAIAPSSTAAVSSAAITVDSSNAAYLTGTYSGSPSFEAANALDGGTGAISVSATGGGADMFLAKYDTTGTPVWVKHAGAANQVIARGDDVTYDGTSIYVSGFKQGDTIFDATNTLTTSSDLFVAKYDTSGNIVWVQGSTTTQSDSGEALGISVPSPASNVTIGGSYAASMTLGSTTLTSVGQDDALTARLCN